MAWAADSDGKTLSLLGTVVRDRGDADPEFAIELVRGSAGPLERTPLFRTTDFPWAELSLARPQEQGGSALVLPPNQNTEAGGWKPSARTLYETTTGAPHTTTVPGDVDSCRIVDARQDKGSLLAIEECLDGTKRLLRMGAGGLQHVLLPSLAQDKGSFRLATASDTAPIACRPVHLLLRGSDDLWIRAECSGDQGAVPAVFRRGHAQKSVVALP